MKGRLEMQISKRKKQGISLIVLVITIIVMIILATAVVITLSNSGIISKANDAVEATDLANAQDLVAMLWADAYIEAQKLGPVTQESIEEKFLAKLEEIEREKGIDLSKYDIIVSVAGVKVEKKKDPAPVITLDSELSEDSTNPTVATGTSYTLTGKVTDEKGVKSLTVNGVAVPVANDGTWTTTLTLVKDQLVEVTMIATDTTGNTTTKTGYVGYITFANFTITAANRHKVGYDANAESQDLVVPKVFYDEETGRWWRVTEIAAGTFSGCENLKNVVLPDSVSNIGSSAFKACSNLTTVNIPSDVRVLRSSVFSLCRSLASINFPDNLTEIKNDAFRNCTSLTSIAIPATVSSISYDAFNGCSSLETVTFAENSQLTLLDARCFASCTSLTSITIPDGVTTIYTGAFSGCINLAEVSIPSSVTSIGMYALQVGAALTDIYYAGTEEQWLAITFGSNYTSSPRNYTIHC